MRRIFCLFIGALYLSSCSKSGAGPTTPNPPVDTIPTQVVITDQPDNGKDTIGNWSLVHHRDVEQLAAWTQLLVPAPDTAFLVNTAWLPTSAFSVSVDGGKTWTDEHFMVPNNELLCMIDGQTGIGYRKSPGTTGGSDIDAFYWKGPTDVRYTRLVYNASGIGYLQTSGISIPSRDFAYITFTNGESVRLKTPFSGSIFNSAGAVPQKVTDLCFPNNVMGWLCTSDGKIMNTKDSSKTWNSQLSVSGTGFSQIYFFDDKNGWASSYNNSIYKTTDGGVSWNKVSVPGITSSMVRFAFTSTSRGFFIAGREAYETSDGGNTWRRSCKMGKEGFQSITRQGNKVYVLSWGSETRTTPINGGTSTSSWTYATILRYL